MSERGAQWYKREPRAFLEGVRRMTERDIAVYAIVLDLIYDGGHQTLDDPKHIASYFSDLGSASVRRTIDRLVEAGKLVREGEFLTNKRAKNEGKTREELRETRRYSAHLGGVSSGKSRTKSNKNNDLSEANASSNVVLDKIREDIEGKEEAKASSKKRGTRLPEDWTLPAEWRAWAEGENLPADVVDLEARKFRNYWCSTAGAKAVKRDWYATWQNWIWKAAADRKPRPSGSSDDAIYAGVDY